MFKQTILLTGANGFLGSYLLETLIQKGYNVVVLKRTFSNLWRIAHLAGQYKSYDIDKYSIENSFEEQHIDFVIHTACHYGRNGDSINQIVESNLMFGLRILDACIKFNVTTFLNTDTLLQRHLNSYTISKKQFVEFLMHQSEKIQIINLKLEHLYGPKDDISKFVPWLISKFKQNAPEILLTKGEQKRDFVYIDDVISAYLKVIEKVPSFIGFTEFDIGSGQFFTIRDFVEQLKGDYQVHFGTVDTKLVFGAIPYREGELINIELNNQRLLDLGWFPKTSLNQGLTNIFSEIK